jgi:ubiquinone/menaquinone biosynthesis C-methylase UbiE
MEDQTMHWKPWRFMHAGALALVLVIPSVANGQLASRPAEEWRKTLDQPTRVDGLKIDEIIARLALKPGLIVADLGAGTGLFSVPMAKAVAAGGRVYAVEIDKGFLPIIETKAKESSLSNVRTVLGEFTDPKLPAQDVDVAFMHDVLHHVENRAGYIKAAARYIKQNGRFAVIDYRPEQSPHRDQPDLIVSEEQVTAWMKAAGFNRVEKVELFPDKYFVVFSR